MTFIRNLLSRRRQKSANQVDPLEEVIRAERGQEILGCLIGILFLLLLIGGWSNSCYKKSDGYYLREKRYWDAFREGSPGQIKTILTQSKVGPQAKKAVVELTPLMIASRYNNNPGVATVIVEAGADIEAKSRKGMSALRYAIKALNVHAVNELIKSGADVGDGALLIAIRFPVETISLLIQAGADVNARDENGETPLMKATSPETIKILLKADADVNAKDENGETPLMYASGQGSPRVIDLLIQAGADVNARNRGGETPLMNLAKHGDGSGNHWAVRSLLRAGADINAKDSIGRTPLMIAVIYYSDTKKLFRPPYQIDSYRSRLYKGRMIEELLEGGPDVLAVSDEGKTALDYGREDERFYTTEIYAELLIKTDAATLK